MLLYKLYTYGKESTSLVTACRGTITRLLKKVLDAWPVL
nr:MAG TPA_asm: hypothetical protein [Caudoviricetes sp.]DAL55585.1 MAG TPA_asm: hypothetical protein [Caudoviricetes sp.]DAQ39862.1 MAG TPA: hypothetical protein [Bacteriophage sp.]DAV51308.1 MAG TPA: hypothetical protein [Caudoviricetes sp.]DAZ12001.1 MAG TPA: hypothetical protein [Caudoviricetes sp.]